MSFTETIARCAAGVSRTMLRGLLHRDAANFPGKLGLYIDKNLIAHASRALTHGSVCVVGTNGKTTTTNLLADALECAGFSVCCNRTGANLDSGVASALLENGRANWAVLECDELWLVHVLPQLRSTYVVLLNLFRDQLDRAGEIELVQQSIIAALKKSPETTLIYNADDPLCTAIAQCIPNKNLAFGINENMNLAQNVVADSGLCQTCSCAFEYEYRQYGQLGKYRCPVCGFARPALSFAAQNIAFASSAEGSTHSEGEISEPSDGFSFDVLAMLGNAACTTPREPATSTPCNETNNAPISPLHLRAHMPGTYMVYNITALAAVATLLGCSDAAIQQAINAFVPNNGRLQRLRVHNHDVLLNLAKNPTGMNQNIRIALAHKQPFALGIFINDNQADGHDVSWLWDVDFQELATRTDIRVFAGGIRKNDLQVRLKYAGITAKLIQDANELLTCSEEMLGNACAVYAIANYTALPQVKAALEKQAAASSASAPSDANPHTPATVTAPVQPVTAAAAKPLAVQPATPSTQAAQAPAASEQPLVIAHMFPALLNLYGDGGNVTILQKRLAWRNIPVEVRTLDETTPFNLTDVDLVFFGGSPDREQKIAADHLTQHNQELAAFLRGGGVCLAICGGYQMLGRTWLVNGEQVQGLALGAYETRRAGSAHDRLVGNIALTVKGISHPVIGYENHAGRTYLDTDTDAFGTLASKAGHGNNDSRTTDGYQNNNLIGTYLHGPLLAKNPEVADAILRRALKRWSARHNTPTPELTPLNDTAELQANAFMARRLNVAAVKQIQKQTQTQTLKGAN